MGSKKKVKPVESAISYSILVILIIIAAVIVLRQFQGTAAESIAANGPKGFKAFKMEEYTPENLYEKIDGKAPLYLEAGFKKLTTQRFVNTTDESLWFENYVYDMTDSKNAFSVYSTQKRSDAEALTDIGTSQAYKTTNGLYFVKGDFYVEMIGSAQSQELLDAAIQVAKQMQVEETLPGEKQVSETDLLQADNLVADSFQLYRGEAFGFDKFGDLYSAKYKMGDQKVTVFMGRCENAQQAKAMAKSYHDFLIENGGEIQNTTQKELENCIVDLYGSYELVTSVGDFIIGVHEAENQQNGEKAILEIINKLKEQAK